VTQVVQHHDGNGYKRPNNRVTVRHEDGTLGHYLHIKKDGARVAVGERVAQGQHLADSGNVGNSMMPHLHFHVTDAERKRTLPISFADVAGDQGIPRMFAWYTSGNTGGAPVGHAERRSNSKD
jgi:murein DD-endopeptidase MepM/ murein hydrolase activator NlpD